MEGDIPLDTVAHMAGHAMRETESALRKVMLPLDFKPEERKEGDNHRQEVEKVISVYEIEDPVRGFWLCTTDRDHEFSLVRWAHRNALEAPRQVDERLRDLWSKFQVMVDMLLEKIETNYARNQKTIDDLVAVVRPTEEQVKILRNRVPNNLVCRFSFFNKLQNPDWLPLLRKERFFDNPPDPVESEDGVGISHPPWPQAVYLINMARAGEEVAMQVKEIVLTVETMNLTVHYELADVALAMPVGLAAEWVKKESRWLDGQRSLPEYLPIEHKLAELISYLAKGEETETSLCLAKSLLQIVPDDKSEFRKARAKINQWTYGEIIQKHIPDLLAASETETFDLLCDRLQSVAAVHIRSDTPPREDYSRIWRRTIADNEDERLHDLEDILVDAVRDAAITILKSDQTKIISIVERLEKRGLHIFDRIALHLLSLFPDAVPSLVADRLTNPNVFSNRSLRVEYDSLSRSCFGKLLQGDQKTIFAWVGNAPPHADRIRERLHSNLKREPTNEELEQEFDEWRLERLAPMRENLPAEWKAKVERWIDQFGKPTPSSEKERIRSTSGSVSPIARNVLAAMSVEEAVDYLKTWTPSGGFDAPSAEGLADVLRSLVAEAPDHFGASARTFVGTNPVYIEALLNGLRDATEKNRKFAWLQVLELCQWVVQQPRDVPIREGRRYGDPPGWVWARGAILYLLERGLRTSECEIPFEFREIVWAALAPLSDDPDPNPHPEPEETPSDTSDISPGINTIRGNALGRVMEYGEWVQRHLPSDSSSESARGGFAKMPEVREVLDNHLNPEIDRSLSIRASYAYLIGTLFDLDAEWTKKATTRIFPREPKYSHLRHAAWGAWVMFCSPGPRAIELLGDEYRYAVERIGESNQEKPGRRHPDYELATHLMTLYWWGRIGLESSGLLARFYTRAGDELCARALQWVGQNLWREKAAIPDDVLLSLRTLWKCRLDAARDSESPNIEELSQFGWWFASGKFEDSWAIEQLSTVLRMTGKIEPQHLVAERLVTLCLRMPYEVLDCFNSLIAHDREGWAAGRCRDEISAVLKETLPGTDPKVLKSRKDLVNRMAGYGFHFQ